MRVNGYQVRIGAAALPSIARNSPAHKPKLKRSRIDGDQDFGACATGGRLVIVSDTLCLVEGRTATDTLKGSCQCLLAILSIFLEGWFGSVVGNTIAIDVTDLTSAAVSFLYDTSSLSAFVNGPFWRFGPAVTLSDESATVSSVKGPSCETSAFENGTRETSALA
jgi:hypothetical protein